MLKVGVIGLGSMGKNHARVCSELDTIDFVGVSDIDKATVSSIANRFNTAAFSEYTDLISKVDAAVVATPTNTHFKIANDLLNAGKHVLVEKPICDTTSDAESLVKIADDENLVLAVGHIERHNPAVKYVKESLDAKDFGDLITLASKRVSNFPGRIRDVGVIFDFGVHDIDVMRYLAGDVVSVYARAGCFSSSIDHEDHANIMLNFDNGICGVVEVNWLTPMKIRKLFLTCSQNFVEMDYINQAVTISSSSFKQVDDMDLYRPPIDFNINQVSLEKREPLKNEIDDFVHAVINNGRPLASGVDGLEAFRVASAAAESYKTGAVVKL